MDSFKGVMCHVALWSEDIEQEDKRVAVISTGASSVQIVLEVSPIAKQLTLFQRTPNMAIPMVSASKTSNGTGSPSNSTPNR